MDGRVFSVKTWLWAEWFLLFVAAPFVVFCNLLPTHKLLLFAVPVIYALAVYLRVSPRARTHSRAHPLVPPRKAIPGILLRAALAALLLSGLILLYDSSLFLSFPRRRPLVWLVVMCGYPWFSALPQEFLYRRFYFDRYHTLFPSENACALSSIAVFAYLHIIYDNVPAVALTVIAGYLFTRTYCRTRSLGCAALEHALYGMIAFSLGLGRFFYEGPR